MQKSDLESLLQRHFNCVEEHGEFILRCERSFRGKLYARYYIDFSGSPPSPDSLVSYQDRILGSDWFNDDSSLRWNSYLVFLLGDGSADDPVYKNQKSRIEADRAYARKFVMQEGELTRFLAVESISDVGVERPASVAVRWQRRLCESGLDEVVGSIAVKTACDRIEAGTAVKVDSNGPLAQSVPVPEAIETILLGEFRTHPTTRNFSFGDVNLLRGSNGAGKTSLLEAIELAYCGDTHRAPLEGAKFVLNVKFRNSLDDVVVKDGEPLQTYRNRHLSWYGQEDAKNKASSLPDSFARFNFLDTDAVSLAAHRKDPEGMTNALATLLIGPEAGRLWTRIVSVSDKIGDRLRRLETEQEALSRELDQLEFAIREASSADSASSALLDRIRSIVPRLGWTDIPNEPRLAAPILDGRLSLLLADLNGRERLEEKGVLTLGGIKAAVQTLVPKVEQVAELTRRESALRTDISSNQLLLEALNLRVSQLERLDRFLVSGLPDALQGLQVARDQVAGASRILATAASIREPLGLDPRLELKLLIERVQGELTTLNERLGMAQQQRAAARAKRSRIDDLRRELRRLAGEFLEVHPDVEECPTCLSHLGKGGLTSVLATVVTGDEGPDLAEELAKEETALGVSIDKTQEELAALEVLEGLALRIGTAAGASTLGEVIAQRILLLQQVKSGQDRVASISAEIALHEAQGLSIEEWTSICGILNLSERSLAEELVEAKVQRDVINQELIQYVRIIEDIRTDLNAVWGESSPLDSGVLHRELSQRLAMHKAFLDSWLTSGHGAQVAEDLSLDQVAAESAQLHDLVRQLGKVIGSSPVSAVLQERSDQREELLRARDELRLRIERVDLARMTLVDLIDNDSRDQAIQAELARSRKDIEAIFKQIHSPREFDGIDESLGALIRKGGQKARIEQISTGQRSAFALSIFLALNRRAANAPPVILIDDPVAHVDDLNTLSFLDYLREIVLPGGRQLFFSTASSKLASLFARKFDFLGSGFRTIDLTRE